MKIKQITDQHRRDFRATIICEGCNKEDKLKGGYDDRNYHDNVIPRMKCKHCGESRNSLGVEEERTETKYPEGFTI